MGDQRRFYNIECFFLCERCHKSLTIVRTYVGPNATMLFSCICAVCGKQGDEMDKYLSFEDAVCLYAAFKRHECVLKLDVPETIQ